MITLSEAYWNSETTDLDKFSGRLNVCGERVLFARTQATVRECGGMWIKQPLGERAFRIRSVVYSQCCGKLSARSVCSQRVIIREMKQQARTKTSGTENMGFLVWKNVMNSEAQWWSNGHLALTVQKFFVVIMENSQLANSCNRKWKITLSTKPNMLQYWLSHQPNENGRPERAYQMSVSAKWHTYICHATMQNQKINTQLNLDQTPLLNWMIDIGLAKSLGWSRRGKKNSPNSNQCDTAKLYYWQQREISVQKR